MPHEVRYLSFARSEVEALLRAGARVVAKPLPAGRLTCFRACDDHFEFRFDRTSVLALTPAECFAFILRWCQAQHIPVGRRMRKRLEIVGEHLVVVLGDIEDAAPSGAALCTLRAGALCASCREEKQACRFDLGADVRITG